MGWGWGWAGEMASVVWVVCPPTWWCCVQGTCTVLCFCSEHPTFVLNSSAVAVGFLVFWYLVHNLPHLHRHANIPYSFLVFCCSKRHLSRLQALQQSVPDARLSPRPALLCPLNNGTLPIIFFCYWFTVWSWKNHFPSQNFSFLTYKMKVVGTMACISYNVLCMFQKEKTVCAEVLGWYIWGKWVKRKNKGGNDWTKSSEVGGNLWLSRVAQGLLGGSDGKESACNVGGPGFIPGSGRSSRKGTGNPLWYSCLENSVDKGT